MRLFSKAMLGAWKAHGDMDVRKQIHPIHGYRHTWSSAGRPTVAKVHSVWQLLCDNPDAWDEYDKNVLESLEQCDRDMLYVGAGAGRFSRAVGALGLNCTNVDIAPECVELMRLRGIDAIEGDVCHLDPFGTGSFPLVVVPPWPFDGCEFSGEGHSADELIAGAARVAGERVIVSGFQLSDDPAPVLYSETMEWEGETDSRQAYAYHSDHVVQMLADAGLVDMDVTLFDDAGADSWIVEGKIP